MDSDKVGNYHLYVFSSDKYLKFNFQTFRFILCHTTSPLPGAYDSGAIHGVLCNTLNGIYLAQEALEKFIIHVRDILLMLKDYKRQSFQT